MLHNRKALAWLMVGLLVLAGCSSTPRVVETKPNPTAVSPEIRAQIEANPEFQLVARLAAQEGKYPDWSNAAQTVDSSGEAITRIPLGTDHNGQWTLIIASEGAEIGSVLLTYLSSDSQNQRIAIADINRNLAVTGSVAKADAKPSVQNMVIGKIAAFTSLSSLISPDNNNVSVQCDPRDPDIVLAIAGLLLATAGLVACAIPFSPWCGAALAAYAVALASYNRVMKAKGCIP